VAGEGDADPPPQTDWQPGDPLPKGEEAELDQAKFRDYSMNPSNPANDGKAESFRDLGYDVDSEAGREQAAQEVEQQLRDKLPDTPAQNPRSTEFGDRLEVRTPIKGPSGKEGTLVTFWQYDKGSDQPRLIANCVEVHR
jgi:hypothetical protein